MTQCCCWGCNMTMLHPHLLPCPKYAVILVVTAFCFVLYVKQHISCCIHLTLLLTPSCSIWPSGNNMAFKRCKRPGQFFITKKTILVNVQSCKVNTELVIVPSCPNLNGCVDADADSSNQMLDFQIHHSGNRPKIACHFEGHAGQRDSSCLAVRHHLAGHFCQSINKHTEIKLGLGGGVMQPEPLTSDLKDGIVASKWHSVHPKCLIVALAFFLACRRRSSRKESNEPF